MTEHTSQHQPGASSPAVVHAKLPKGLITTGLVAIVGSWIGMAVYMNHRLDAVENQLIGETGKVAQSMQENQQMLNRQVASIEDNVLGKVKDTSSVLAKGILDLSQSEESRHQELSQAVLSNLDLLKNHRAEIEAILTHGNDKQTETLTGLISSLTNRNNENSQAVMAALRNMEKQVGATGQSLAERIDQSAGSLHDLIAMSQEQTGTKLNELASSVGTLSETKGISPKQFETQLTALANRVDSFKEEIHNSQDSAKKLSQLVPQWKSSSDEYLEGISEKAQALNKNLEAKIANLQSRIATLDSSVDESAEAVMKTLFMTTQGFEGANMDLRTDMATLKDDTTNELQKLNQTIELVTASLAEISTKIENGRVTSFSMSASPEFQDVIQTLKTFSSRTIATRAQLKSQLDEAKTRLEHVSKNAGAINTQSIQTILNEVSQYMTETDDQIGQLEGALKLFAPTEATVSADAVAEEDNATIGLNTILQPNDTDASLH